MAERKLYNDTDDDVKEDISLTKEEEDDLIKDIVEAFKEQDEAERKINAPRRLRNWLYSYLKLTEESESPAIFHLWAAVSVIAAALRRRVFMDRVTYILYPNLYVVLTAESAKCKKSTCIKFAEKIIKELGTVHIVKEKVTPEGLLARMAINTVTDGATLSAGEIGAPDGAVYIVAEELSVFFSNIAYSSGMISIMTGLYNCADDWDYTTRHNPITVYNAYPNVLGGSTPEWLAQGMPEHSQSGGFLGRFLFIVAHDRKKPIAWPEKFDGYDKLKEDLIEDLKAITSLQGEMTVTDAARDIFRTWYDPFEGYEDPRLVEYGNRKGDTILKIAMILSVACSNSLIVDDLHMKAAMRAVERLEDNMLDAFTFLGSTAESQLGKQVLSILSRNGPMTKSKIIKLIGYRLRKLSDLDDVINMLRAEDAVVKEMRNSKVYFRITSEEEKLRAERARTEKLESMGFSFDGDGNLVA